MSPALVNGGLAVAAFALGVVLVVWSTGRLLHGLIGLAAVVRLAPFAIAGVLSGLEAENVAVGLAAGQQQAAGIALGTVFGGGIFIVCGALGLGALIYPLQVRVPRAILLSLALSPVVAGLAVISPTTPRLAGALLLAAFVILMVQLVKASRTHHFLDSSEIAEIGGVARPAWWWVGLTLFGIAVITIGAELVTFGATRAIVAFALPPALVGMVITPAAIEMEEVVRQAVPAREGRPDVSAGNLVGTIYYFVLFNLGLIALLTPVRIPQLTRTLDWPYLIGSTWLATIFLWRGGVNRLQAGVLLMVYAAYVGLHVVLR